MVNFGYYAFAPEIAGEIKLSAPSKSPKRFAPVSYNCIDCGEIIHPKLDRQELVWDPQKQIFKLRCGPCIMTFDKAQESK